MKNNQRKNKKALVLVAMILMIGLVAGMGAMTYSRYISAGKVENVAATAAKWGFIVNVNADNVFGSDYDTKDGTGVRDYIHVVDLARAHVLSIEKIIKEKEIGLKIYNLGTGTGYSVLDIVNAFNRVNGDLVKYELTDRRPGDVATCYASPKLAEEELGFKAQKNLDEMCKSSYQYQKNNKK